MQGGEDGLNIGATCLGVFIGTLHLNSIAEESIGALRKKKIITIKLKEDTAILRE